MRVYLLVFLLIPTSYALGKCASDNGIFCECSSNLENGETKIWNCIRPGGWSTWSKWSKCREGTRKRRRICNNPMPIGTTCSGARVEKQPCVVSSPKIPEFLFGEWTSWNPWSRCDCDRSLRLRTRHCKGNSCEGCDKQYENCLESVQLAKNGPHGQIGWIMVTNRLDIQPGAPLPTWQM